jgi:hypothetical protein
MKGRLISACVLVVGLALALGWTVTAQQLPERASVLSGGEQGVRATSAITLGQPGTSFRYVETFGVAETPYFSDAVHINRPWGLFIDSSDNLYVTEEQGYRMLRYNSAGVNTLAIGIAGMSYTDDYAFYAPQDAALDGSGSIWVADGHRVVQYSAGGTFLQQQPADDPWDSGSDNERFENVHGIAFDSIGRMYVSDTDNHRIQVYTFTVGGSPVYSATIGVTDTPGSDNSHFDSPYRLAMDDSDRLYVVDAGNDRVQRCAFGGGWTCTTFDSGLNNPQGITVDGSNNVYIADTENGRVRKCSSAGVCSDLVTGTYGLYDLAVDSAGNVYGAAAWEAFVVRYDSGGNQLGGFVGVEGVPYLTDGYHYNRPRIAIDGSDDIILAEENGQRLLKLDANGTLLWAVGVPGVDSDDNTHFNYPHGVAVGNDGRIYVADGCRVQIFTGGGTYTATLGTGCGTGDYQFSWATGVAVDDNDYIYVADYPNHRVQIYDSDRVFVGRIGATGQCGTANDRLCMPIGIEVDSAGNIYVADGANCRVQKFNSSRVYQMTFGTTGSCTGDLADISAEDVTVDAQGRVYVSEWDHDRVQVFDSSGAYLTTIGGAWGSRSSQFRFTSGVAVDSAGHVYVSDSHNGRIQKYTLGVPGWQQVNIDGFGDRDSWGVNRMSVFGNYLYASANNQDTGGEVWRTADGTDWSQVNLDGFGIVSNTTAAVGEALNGYLYVGTGNTATGAEVWRCSTCDGSDWTRVVSGGLGDPNSDKVERIVVFSNTLYATANNSSTGAEVWRSSTGDPGSWTQCNTDGFGDANNQGLWAAAVFSDYLYVATGQWKDTYTGVEVWRTNDGVTWNQVNTDGFGDPENRSPWIEPFGGYLYVSSHNGDTGSQIWRCATCNGADWEQVIGDGFGDSNTLASHFMLGFDGYFYACAENSVTGVEVWRTANGTSWSQVNVDGFGDSNNRIVWSGAVFNERLYLGTANGSGADSPANGGEVWMLLHQVYLPLVLRDQ